MDKPPDFPKSFEDIISFPLKVDTYLNDWFGLRRELIGLYNTLLFLMKSSPRGSEFIIGKQGWMFLKGALAYKNKPTATPERIQRFTTKHQQLDKALRRLGITLILVIPPNKSEIYQEYLPPEFSSLFQSNELNDLYKDIEKFPELNFVELKNALELEKENGAIYLKVFNVSPKWTKRVKKLRGTFC
jgi:hypothetical protein